MPGRAKTHACAALPVTPCGDSPSWCSWGIAGGSKPASCAYGRCLTLVLLLLLLPAGPVCSCAEVCSNQVCRGLCTKVRACRGAHIIRAEPCMQGVTLHPCADASAVCSIFSSMGCACQGLHCPLINRREHHLNIPEGSMCFLSAAGMVWGWLSALLLS